MKSPEIAVVLVEPKGDANIGMVARAMKNFGLRDLRLINPVDHLTKSAYMWAVEARDLLDGASVHKDLAGALGDSACAVAFTRRIGKRRKKQMSVSEAAGWMAGRAKSGGVALVFGREDKGLSNDEVRLCDLTASIPTSKALPSINLAQSVLIACYEIFFNLTGGVRKEKKKRKADGWDATQKFVSRREIAAIMKRLGLMLDVLGYCDAPKAPLRSKIMHQFERIFGRAGLTPRDIGMFEGLSARIIEGVFGVVGG